jgi:hypothetical protein
MRPIFVVPAGLALVSAVSVSDRPVGAGSRAAEMVEVTRIRAHFDSVLTELAGRDVSGLTAAQRMRREALTTTLDAYRDRGVFPHNYDFPGQAVPYFVDRKTGTLCAVAHLLESTGRRDIVDRVASLDNNVWVPQLAGDAPFMSWLHDHGLTLDEAARIQVPYMDDNSSVVSAMGSRTAVYLVGSTLTIGSAAATAIWNGGWNASGRRTLGNVLGVTTGLLAIGFGAAASQDQQAPPAVAALSLAVGGMSTLLASRGFVRHQRLVSQERSARAREGIRIGVTPILPVTSQSGTGLGVRVTF